MGGEVFQTLQLEKCGQCEGRGLEIREKKIRRLLWTTPYAMLSCCNRPYLFVLNFT